MILKASVVLGACARAHRGAGGHAQHPKKLGVGMPNTLIKSVRVLCLDPTINVSTPNTPI